MAALSKMQSKTWSQGAPRTILQNTVRLSPPEKILLLPMQAEKICVELIFHNRWYRIGGHSNFYYYCIYQFLTSDQGSQQYYQASNYPLLPQMRIFVSFSAAPQLVR